MLWDVTDPAGPAAWASPLTGHTDAVYSVAFAPDGHTLATASYDETVLLWDLTDPAGRAASVSPLTGHTDAVCRGGVRPGRAHPGHRQRRPDGASCGT